MKARHSGLQKAVLTQYRMVLKTIGKKCEAQGLAEDKLDKLRQAARRKYMQYAFIPKTNIALIEYYLRRGERQRKLLALDSLDSIELVDDVAPQAPKDQS